METTLSGWGYGIRVVKQEKNSGRGILLRWEDLSRPTCGQQWKKIALIGLALMHIHKHDVSLNSESIADDFARLEAEGWSSFSKGGNSSTFSMATEKVAV